MLAAGTQCSFSLQLQLPAAAANGVYTSTSSMATGTAGSGTAAGAGASAGITLASAPLFSRSFAPTSAEVGTAVRLTYVLDNTANVIAADAASFNDALPAGLLIGSPANSSTDCSFATLTATAGGTSIAFTGANLPAASLCTLALDVVASAPGTYTLPATILATTLGDAAAPSASHVAVAGAPVTPLVPLQIPVLDWRTLTALAAMMLLLGGIGYRRRG
jgi:uncharacterized repeat protein (TIGR01451 family)